MICSVPTKPVKKIMISKKTGMPIVEEEKPEVEKLDLSLLSEIKRSEKGALELKLLDRLAVLEQLAALTSKEDGTMELLQALGNAGEAL